MTTVRLRQIYGDLSRFVNPAVPIAACGRGADQQTAESIDKLCQRYGCRCFVAISSSKVVTARRFPYVDIFRSVTSRFLFAKESDLSMDAAALRPLLSRCLGSRAAIKAATDGKNSSWTRANVPGKRDSRNVAKHIMPTNPETAAWKKTTESRQDSPRSRPLLLLLLLWCCHPKAEQMTVALDLAERRDTLTASLGSRADCRYVMLTRTCMAAGFFNCFSRT